VSKADSARPGPRTVRGPKQRVASRQFPWRPVSIATAVAVLLGASFVVPSLFEDGPGSAGGGHGHAVGAGDGPDLGTRIPFSERDVVSGDPISSKTVRGRKTLLFFSEGVMCQACFEQIRDIEKVGTELEKRGVALVSITPDDEDVLTDAIDQYEITTPMISDEDRDMSAAFDTLGQGMHSDTPGHAFVLLDKAGKVVWQRDYWLAPYRKMYVEPAKLLDDLASVTQTH
jgi:peroxiredoxin